MGPTSTISAPSTVTAIEKVRAKLRAVAQYTLSERQTASLKEVQEPDTIWVSHATFPPPPEDDMRQAMFAVVKHLRSGNEIIDWPTMTPVEVEWIGQRALDEQAIPKSLFSEKDKFSKLMRHVSSRVTILYIHGGAY